MTEWLNKLHPDEEALKRQMLESLSAAEKKSAQEKAQHRAERFDQKRWKKLSRSLRARIRRVPADGDAAHCQALERLEEAKELHRRAMRTDSPKPWHALRIAVKHFRYTLESLLPTAHAACSDTLKRVQDVLGNIHDLDVLCEMLCKANASQCSAILQGWELRIENERQLNVQTYRQLALGTASIWTHWQSGFPREEWERYAKARIRATRSAMDPKPSRSLVIARIAMRIWSQLRLRKAGEIFFDKKERRALDAAARLSGVRDASTKRPAKNPRNLLAGFAGSSRLVVCGMGTRCLGHPVPAWRRARPPQQALRTIGSRTADESLLVGGILRLAITAQKCGVTHSSSLRLELCRKDSYCMLLE